MCSWEQCHDTAISGSDCSELGSRDKFGFVCVLVNWPQYHDTVNFVQDPETEDPHLIFPQHASFLV